MPLLLTAALNLQQPASFQLLKTIGAVPAFPALIVLAVLVAGIKALRRPAIKGMIGEAVVHWGALSKLNKQRYRVLKNVFVPSLYRCGMTELDHVVLSAHGIFVIETKNYGGWIFGSEKDQNWTYSNRGNKYQFTNPLIQNHCHVASLAAFLGLPKTVFHSMVVFVGEAQIKTPMPPNVLTTGVRRYIESKDKILLSESQLENAWERLCTHDAEMEKGVVRREHIARLSDRAGR